MRPCDITLSYSSAEGTRVQIYLLSRDRPAFLRQALESALAQDEEGVEVIVSDNSEGDAVQDLIAREFPQVRYIRRRPTLSMADHGNAVFRESSAEFVVYFNDDDLLEPGYATEMVRALEAHPDVVAVGCNAWTLKDGVRIRQPRMGLFRRPRKIHVVEELVEYYLDFTPVLLAPPFPSYMYRRSRMDGVYSTTSEAGKYGDVSFLMRVLERGAILWLPQPDVVSRARRQ
jgi:GT2 family glycosyltransferase